LGRFALEWYGVEYQFNTLLSSETRLIELPAEGSQPLLATIPNQGISLNYTLLREGSKFYFSMKDTEAIVNQVVVYNIKGQKSFSSKFPDSDRTTTVEMQNQPNGIYLFKVDLQTPNRKLYFKHLYLK